MTWHQHNHSVSAEVSSRTLSKMLRKKSKNKAQKKRGGGLGLEKKKIQNYSQEQLDQAISDVRQGMSTAAAARKNNIPRTSLLYKAKGLRSTKIKMGPVSVLTKEEEEILAKWIIASARVGLPVSKVDLLDSVQKLLKDMKRENKFTEGRPGRSWYNSFMRRNPTVSVRTPQNLTSSRSSVTSDDINKWADNIMGYFKENDYDRILEDPSRVFNADETAFFLNPKGNQVLAGKGDRSVYQQISADEKECITVLITANADGRLAPPLLVLRYKRIPAEITLSIPPNWGVGTSENGWMSGPTFYEYIANVFHPWLIERELQLPVILFIDGHSSHLTLHVSQFCSENGIILVSLYPNSTHLQQPMDVSVFSPLKSTWREETHQWRRDHIDNPSLKKRDFSLLLLEALDEVSPVIIRNGFKKCGLVPWNPSAVISTLQMKEKAFDPDTAQTHTASDEVHNSNDVNVALMVVREFIGREKVGIFDASEEWTGCVEDRSLFQLWKDMKSFSHGESQSNSGGTPYSCRTARLNQDVISEITPVRSQSVVENPQGNLIVCDFASTSAQQITPSGSNPNLPSPFKRSLIWPDVSHNLQKTRKRETLPSVVTSKSWQEYHEKKAKKKLEMEFEKQSRAEERKRKKAEKEELQRKKKNEKAQKKKAPPPKRNGKKSRRKLPSSSESEGWEPSDVSVDEDPQASDEEEPDEDVTVGITDEQPGLSHQEMLPSATAISIEEELISTDQNDEYLISNIWNLDGLDINLNLPDEQPVLSHQEILPSDEGWNARLIDVPVVQNPQASTIPACISSCMDVEDECISSSIDVEDEGRDRDPTDGKNLKNGDFVIIKLQSKKGDVECFCKIKTVLPNKCAIVITMNPVNRMGNVFRMNYKDERKVPVNQVLRVLPKRTKFGRDSYRF